MLNVSIADDIHDGVWAPFVEKGLPKATTRYTVIDKLTIAPMTPISAIPSVVLLWSLGVRYLTAVQGNTNHIYYKKVISILSTCVDI